MSDITATDTSTTAAATTSGRTARVLRRLPRSADRDPERFTRRRRIIELSLAIGFPVVMLTLWQIAAVNDWIDRFSYPAPSDIIAEIRRGFQDNPKGNWWVDVGVSLQRMLWGYFWGLLVGLFAGVTMGMSRTLRAMLEPTLSALYTVPKIALIGIFLIIFGFDNTPLIAVIAVTVFFFVWIQAMAAVMSVSEGYREAAASFGTSRWQMFRHIIMPASLPQIFVGLRVAAGVAVLTLIGIELVFAPGAQGIGYRINNARQILDPKQAYVGLVVAALLGVIFTGVIKWIGRLVTKWAPEDNAIG
jgi:sulfonate transport system permease protein